MLQPNHIITLAGEGIRILRRWHKHMNRMFRCEALDDFNRRNHVTISRNDNRNVAALGKQIYKHPRRDSYIRLLFLIGFNLKSTILTLYLLFLINPKMKFEFRIRLIRLEKFVLVVICLRIINRTGRIVIHFYQFLVRQHHPLKKLHNVKPIMTLPLTTSVFKPIIEVVPVNVHNNFLLIHN